MAVKFNQIFPTIQNKKFAYVFHIKTYIFEFSIFGLFTSRNSYIV